MRTSEHRGNLSTDVPGSEPAHHARAPRRSRGGWVAIVVILAVVTGVGAAGYWAVKALGRTVSGSTCSATAAGATVQFTTEQTANAALIAAISQKRGLPARAATIAIATAIQESKLRNLTYGDRDSVGLFQQRPSMGWGTRDQVLDPVYSTNKFYDALVKIRGYESMEITKVAQAVQKSAYPLAYADHEQEGRILASTLRGHSPAGLVCDPGPVESGSDSAAVAADLSNQYGIASTVDGAVLTVTGGTSEQAWGAAQWAVARSEGYGIDRVQVGERAWSRAEDPATWTSGAPMSPGGTAMTVTIRLGGVQP